MAIPDFTESELWLNSSTWQLRWGGEIDIPRAERALRRHPRDCELTACPTAIRRVEDCAQVVRRTRIARDPRQFYYSVLKASASGIREDHHLRDCVATRLRTQAGHEADAPRAHGPKPN